MKLSVLTHFQEKEMFATRVVRFAALAALAVAYASPLTTNAQEFPGKPIRIIAPVPPGGLADGLARQVGNRLQERLGWVVVTENRPGGNFVIGLDHVAKSAPDGHTLIVGIGSMPIMPSTMRNLPFDLRTDFVPITKAVVLPVVLLVNPALPATTLKDLIAYSKANPGKLSYGTSGMGTNTHLAAELLKQMTGIDMVAIPYKGQPTAALLSGEVQVSIDAVAGNLGHVRAGTLRALAILSPQRSSALPDVPTMAQLGYPEYDAASWLGFFAPKGTARDVVLKLNREIVAILKLPETVAQYQKAGADVEANSADEFARQFQSAIATWDRVVRTAGIKLE
jgi:tripartite-type tricarboxylate transporter receptor subunit TctC